jgi:hypothetical protein
MHDIIVVGVPLLAILAGILFNNSNSARIEARIDNLAARIDRIQSDLAQFYMILGKHDAKIEALEKKA